MKARLDRPRPGHAPRRWLQALALCALAFIRVHGHASSDVTDWRLGVAAWSFNRFTFYEAVDRTSALGIKHLEAFEGQRVNTMSDAKLDPSLPDAAIADLRAKLESANITLTSIYIHELSTEEPLCRQSFEFAQKLGVETIISEPRPEALNHLEQLCAEFDLKVALHNHPQGSSRYWHPREILRVLDGRSPRLGACADLGHWQRSGIAPVEGIRMLGSRLLSLHVKDLNEAGPNGHDVWWGTGQGDLAAVLREVHRAGIRPTLFAIEYEHNWDDNRNDIAACARFFSEQTASIVAANPPPDPLFAGWASTVITPPQPVALVGQLHKRISTGVRDPLTATVLALETRGPGGRREPVILVSADLIMIPRVIQDRLREMLEPRLSDFDTARLFMFGTHTHTAPGLVDATFGDRYDVSADSGVMKASEYAHFFLDRVGRAVEQAWKNRAPARMGWAMSHAVTGFNRRSVYADGRAVMYGNTADLGFSHIEGGTDSAVDVLGFWNAEGRLRGVVVNAACPSQEVEGLSEISADFWHDLRLAMRARHGENLFVLPQCAPSGDLSPHPIYRQRTEQLMDQRRGLSRRQVIARRLAHAVEDALEVAAADRADRLVLRHKMVRVDLPEHQPAVQPFYQTDTVRPVELHVLRLGEVAMATNPFELFHDYATRIEARSVAPLTMLIQLGAGSSGYLPTERAVQGGGYSADKFVVGPTGGQVLVEETVKQINQMFR
jgi:sugar phosphate isomerase/epimerase